MPQFSPHAVIDWTIDNSSFLRRHRKFSGLPFKDKFLETPTFDVVGSIIGDRSIWNLSLVLNKTEDDYTMSLQLKFHYSEGMYIGSLGVFKFTYIDDKNEVLLEKQCMKSLKKNEEIVWENFRFLRDLDTSFKFEADGACLKIICEIILIDAEQTQTDRIQVDADDIGKDSLSFDILRGYKESIMTDVTLRMQDGEIRAHKAVLYARSKHFEGILTPTTDVIDLPDFKTNVMKKVLEFMYMGISSCLLMGNPLPIGTYECAQKLGISDLEYFLTPVRIKVNTFVPLNQYDFDWCIDDFYSLDDNYMYVSQILDASWDSCHFDLHLFTSTKSSKHLSLNFIRSLIDAADLFVEIFLIDKPGNIFYKKENVLIFEPENERKKRTFDFSNLFRLNYSMFLEGKFTLRFKITYPDKDLLSDYISNMEVSLPKLHSTYVDAQQNFCDDMLKLYKSNHLSDVDFLLQGEIFKAHKCILAMRSPYYNGMFSNDCVESRTGQIKSDMDSVSLDIFLKYIYSGAIIYENANIFKSVSGYLETLLPLNTVLDLYEASDMYQLKSLKTIFLFYWPYAIDNSTDVLFDILPSVCAYNDQDSMKEIVSAVFYKEKEIFETQEWADLIRENSQLNNVFQEFKADMEM